MKTISEWSFFMTNDNIKKIIELRGCGYGYQKISNITGISVNTIRSYCKRNGIEKPQSNITGYCKNCNKPVCSTPHRKQKIFCCDKCRLQWWSKNRDLIKQKSVVPQFCILCGKQFFAYNSSNRKFCSHDCYIQYRYYQDGVHDE